MDAKGPAAHKAFLRSQDEGRDFRSAYYGKVGGHDAWACKILTTLANEKFVDLNKVTQVIQRYSPPSERRLVIWMRLLGVIPNGCDNKMKSVVKTDQKLMCDQLLGALKTMGFIDNFTPSPSSLLLMYLLEQGQLRADVKRLVSLRKMQDIEAIAANFIIEAAKFEESYWMFRNFQLQKYNRTALREMADRFTIEDAELEAHLKGINGPECIPVDVWFLRLYAGIIHKDSLVKIWDKVIIGATKILPLTARMILSALKKDLLDQTSGLDIRTRLLAPLPSETSELIVTNVLAQKLVP